MQPKLFSMDGMLKRIKTAKANKQKWEQHLKECYEYAMPERETVDSHSPGQKKNQKRFDSTAVMALEDFSARMESQLVPAWRKWFKLEVGSEIPEENEQEVEEYLEEATDIIFDHINHSNFNAQIKETFLDLGVSTGCIIVEEGDGINTALNFRSVSLSEVILERSARGIPETVWREVKVPVADIQQIWPKAELTQSIKDKISSDPTQEIKLIEGVAQDHKTRDNISMLLDMDGKEALYEEKLDISPWIIFREATIPGEVYGRGRVMKCLDQIKVLNKMVENYLRALEWQAHPLFTATDESVRNPYNMSLRPGSITVVDSNDRGNPSIAPMPVGGNPQLLEFAVVKWQDFIRQAMMSKPFGNVEDTPVRSATEMSMRNADLQSVQGSAAGRLQTELIERLINNVAEILMRAGKLQPMKIDGKMVTIKFTSPIARQQDADELMVLMQGMEMLAGLDPNEVKRELKTEEVPEFIIDKLGLPSYFKRSDMEKQEYDQKMQQQMQAMMEQQNG
jgi:hypothetical protein